MTMIPVPPLSFYLALDTPGDDNGYAMYLATECTDARWPPSWLTWHRDNTRVARDVPFVTWGNAWFNAPCAFRFAASGQPVDVDGAGAPPILLLDETLDAATPYTGSLEVRERFPNASLIATVGGVNHANSLFGGVACVDDAVAAYLADGTLPARLPGDGADAECAPTPDPEPDAAASVSARTNAQAATATVTVDRLRLLHPMPR